MRCFVLLVSFLALAANGQNANTLEQYFRQTLENFREKMKTGIPEIQMMPLDPLKIPHIPIYIKEGVADVTIMIDNLEAEGLSGFNIKSLKVDLATMTVKAVLTLPQGQAQAHYDLKGKILGFIPLYGNGKAIFTINDLEIGVETKIDITSGLQLQTFGIKLQFSQVVAYLENILGGGDISAVINQIISSLGKVIFDSQRGNIENALNGVIRNAINNELKKVNIGAIGYSSKPMFRAARNAGNANSYFDNLLKSARSELRKLDPLNLPYLKKGFSKRVGLITFEGYAELHHGKLHGLSTLARTGDVTLSHNAKTGMIALAGTIGIRRVQVSYLSTLKFLFITATPILHAVVPSVDVHVQVNINPKTNQKSLAAFRIVKLARPSVSISNLPVLAELATLVINLAMDPISNSLKGTIENEVRKIIANEINKIQIDI